MTRSLGIPEVTRNNEQLKQTYLGLPFREGYRYIVIPVGSNKTCRMTLVQKKTAGKVKVASMISTTLPNTSSAKQKQYILYHTVMIDRQNVMDSN